MTSKYRNSFFSAFAFIYNLKKAGQFVYKARAIKKFDLVQSDFYLLVCLVDFALTGKNFYCGNRNLRKKKEMKEAGKSKINTNDNNNDIIEDGYGSAWL